MPRLKDKKPLQTRLWEKRKECWLTVDRLTKNADVSYVTYTKLEDGSVTNPTLRNIVKIARALDISVDELTHDMYRGKTDLPEKWVDTKKNTREEKERLKKNEKILKNKNSDTIS